MTYRGGQQPIIHLQADFHAVVQWANRTNRRWAFSTGNAGAYLTTFHNHASQLTEIDWAAVQATDFRDAKVKEGKQAEFLLYEHFPWELIEKIGVMNGMISARVQSSLQGVQHQPAIAVERSWYY